MEKTNTKAVISLTFGILSILIPIGGLIFGIVGVVMSRMAVKAIAASNEKGSGMATAGLITGLVGIVFQFLGVLGIIAFYNVSTIG
ncbi:DUF4190 domain-containing protein [Sutcliffiella deserti]|uniref:DUF4190 domain-containing protein n=1 Tax=Sutcliffiella deserti TaxID=2875501 RepID=UPI001CC0E0CF|nr:DUF4190 domain-containing protein [Sutcliffiella deserti]